MTNDSALVSVILSGGSGTRLWPASRKLLPKPFIRIPTGRTLLQESLLRATDQKPDAVFTVTNRELFFKIRDEYQELEQTLPAMYYLLEPIGRNTAPAVLMAALTARDAYGDNVELLVLAADHLIKRADQFNQAVSLARQAAREGYLGTFGIQPLSPDTGYGYIELGETLTSDQTYRANRFEEKPDRKRAEEFLATDNYVWNSGMFCFTAETLLQAARQHAPDLLAAVEGSYSRSNATEDGKDQIVHIDEESFAGVTDISIDYAIMEKAQNVAVIKADVGWSDIGSWTAMSALTPADDTGNRVQGQAILHDSRNCFVSTRDSGRLAALVGVEDLVVVDTPDALLVAHADKVQDVKHVVSRLKESNHESHLLHKTAYRPWGSYTVLEDQPRFKIKSIEVKPGEKLSLQMHHHRSEHWVVVSGMARVVNGEEEFLLNTNESTFIPAGHRHRLENPGVIPLVIIEVQSGDYLGEDDIVRFEDSYGRN